MSKKHAYVVFDAPTGWPKNPNLGMILRITLTLIDKVSSFARSLYHTWANCISCCL